MKTKRYSGYLFAPLELHRGEVVYANQDLDDDSAKDIAVLDIRRNSSVPPRTIGKVHSPINAEVVHEHHASKASNGTEIRYEVLDVNTKSVTVYTIPRDILSRHADDDDADDEDPDSATQHDWQISECRITIQNDTKLFCLSRRTDDGQYHLQRFSFASPSSLREISVVTLDLEIPPSPHEDEWMIATASRGRGIMAATLDEEDDDSSANIMYIWYDHDTLEDTEANIHRKDWTIEIYANPFLEADLGTLFPMGDTLYGILPNDDLDQTDLNYLREGGAAFDQEPVDLRGTTGSEVVEGCDVLCDDRYAFVTYSEGAIVLEWHDYDSWRESRDEGWAEKELVGEVFWTSEEEDSCYENYKYQ
ncbi:hypothetical protein ABW19_dt0209049 [Dactylella cylindrospora]|nr:hypothetical protein ABW19_dt0209049 [Dactylella cylindrospora]